MGISSGAWSGHIDAIWSCPADPFVAVVACSREHLDTDLHPAVAETSAPFALAATTLQKAAQLEKAKLEAAASLAKAVVPFAKIALPEQGKTHAGSVVVKIQPQNVPADQWTAQCCEIELSRSPSATTSPTGPWLPPITYSDRNDVLTPLGWSISAGALEPGWWRIRARGCCITNPDTGLGAHWPWSPWREFHVLLPISPGVAKSAGGGSEMPGPPGPGGAPRSAPGSASRSESVAKLPVGVDRAQLTVRAIAVQPATPAPGQPLRFAITVVNEGSAAGQGPIWIGYSVPSGGAWPFPVTSRSLRAPHEPKQRQVLVFEAPAMGPGRYAIKAGPERALGAEAFRIDVTVPAIGRAPATPRRAA